MPNAAPATEPPRFISIVLPVLNEAGRLPGLLGHLGRDFPEAEVLVVDGGSGDHTVAVALRAGVTVLLGRPGRASQMNLGAASASGVWLLFLHADSMPRFRGRDLMPWLHAADPGDEQGDASAGIRGAADGPTPVWGFFRVCLDGRLPVLRVIAAFMNRRSRLTRVATGDQGLFVRRDVFAAIGGFAPIPLMEDVEICKRLRREAAPVCPPLVVASSGRRWEEQGVLRTVLRMWILRLAFWLGVAPERLWHHYYGRAALASQADTLVSERD